MAATQGQIDVLLYGLGAIGSFYAFILSRCPNVRLTVVARSNYDAVKANGFKIISDNHGEHSVKPYKVVRTTAEAAAKFDYVVCAHKAIDQASGAEQIAPGVDEDNTTIVLIQNGVGNEEPFRKRFPTTTIISCVTWVGARQPEPGVIKHSKSENTQIGLFPNAAKDAGSEKQRLDTFSGLLTTGNTVFQVVPDIQVYRWEKVVWNAAWNTITTLTLMNTLDWLSSSEDAIPMTRSLMTEVIDVARKCDVPLEYTLVDTLIEKILKMQPICSSMQTDYIKGRPLEIEAILGYPTRKAKEFGLPIPIIQTLYTLLTAVNLRLIREAENKGSS